MNGNVTRQTARGMMIIYYESKERFYSMDCHAPRQDGRVLHDASLL